MTKAKTTKSVSTGNRNGAGAAKLKKDAMKESRAGGHGNAGGAGKLKQDAKKDG